MTVKLNINQWAEEDRPREKLMRLGAQSLTDSELLAILIGSGSPQESAVDLMKRVMSDCSNSLNRLGKMSLADLTRYNGIGEAKAISIIAACELGKRRSADRPEERLELNSATRIYNLIHPRVQDNDVEEFWLILLNQRFKLIKFMPIARGGISEVTVDVRVIVREAVLANATVVAVAHNHPSGIATPSRADDDITKRIKSACDLMRLHFMDHIIVADGSYYSYHEEGRL